MLLFNFFIWPNIPIKFMHINLNLMQIVVAYLNNNYKGKLHFLLQLLIFFIQLDLFSFKHYYSITFLCIRQSFDIYFDIHGSVHRGWLSRNTNKMHLCNRIYYSKVYWMLNMFRVEHRSSSGALHCVCSLWFIYPCSDRPLSSLSWKHNLKF
jgi:hypothetical protein